MKIFLACILLAITFFVSACNPSWPHQYDTLLPQTPFQGFGKTVVLVRDNRNAVVDGLLNPEEVGVVESLGKSFTIQTATGNPLAQDIGFSICNSLSVKGFDCMPLVSGRAPIEDEIQYVTRTQKPLRTIFININEWDVKVFLKAKVEYAFGLKIFNNAGATKVTLNTAGKEEAGSITTVNPAREASEAVPQTMNKILSSLLSHPQVVENMNMGRDIDAMGIRYSN